MLSTTEKVMNDDDDYAIDPWKWDIVKQKIFFTAFLVHKCNSTVLKYASFHLKTLVLLPPTFANV